MKSVMTKPSKPHSSRSTSVSSACDWPAHSPLSELYELITLATPSSTTRLKCGRYTSWSARVVGGDVDREPRVLHRVAREVLHAREHVLLHAAGERGAHLAEQVRVLAVGLLRATPRRVAQQVHADAAEVGGADGPRLEPDDAPDLLLERDVERRGARHRHGEARGVADDDAARPVGEREAGDAEPRVAGRGPGVAVVAAARHVGEAGPERHVAVEEVDHLVVGEPAATSARRPRPSRVRPGAHARRGVAELA